MKGSGTNYNTSSCCAKICNAGVVTLSIKMRAHELLGIAFNQH